MSKPAGVSSSEWDAPSRVIDPEYLNLTVFKRKHKLEPHTFDSMSLGYKNEAMIQDKVLVRLFIINDTTKEDKDVRSIMHEINYTFKGIFNNVDVYYAEVNYDADKDN